MFQTYISGKLSLRPEYAINHKIRLFLQSFIARAIKNVDIAINLSSK